MLGNMDKGTSGITSAQEEGTQESKPPGRERIGTYQQTLNDATITRKLPTSENREEEDTKTREQQGKVQTNRVGAGTSIMCPRNNPQRDERKIRDSPKNGKK